MHLMNRYFMLSRSGSVKLSPELNLCLLNARMATWSKAWVCICLLANIGVPIPLGSQMSVSCECCVLSGRGLCDRLIACLEESY